MRRPVWGSGFFTTGTWRSGNGMCGIRVWARLLGLRGVGVDDVRMGGERQVIMSARRSWRERDWCGLCRRHGVVVCAVPWAWHDSTFTRRRQRGRAAGRSARRTAVPHCRGRPSHRPARPAVTAYTVLAFFDAFTWGRGDREDSFRAHGILRSCVLRMRSGSLGRVVSRRLSWCWGCWRRSPRCGSGWMSTIGC